MFWIVWTCAMVAFAILELATDGLVSVWFLGGALGALIADLFGASWPVQIVVFLIVSIALLACLRPFVRRFVAPKKTATNVDALIGKQATMLCGAKGFEVGTVKLDGKEWSVRSLDGKALPEGSVVQIVKVEGVTLLAMPAETYVP